MKFGDTHTLYSWKLNDRSLKAVYNSYTEHYTKFVYLKNMVLCMKQPIYKHGSLHDDSEYILTFYMQRDITRDIVLFNDINSGEFSLFVIFIDYINV